MTECGTTTPIRGVVDRYIAVRNEPDADARSPAIADLGIEHGPYTDPLAAAEGHEAMEAVIVGAREQFPGHVDLLAGLRRDAVPGGPSRSPPEPQICLVDV
jgi:hypothetical protein